MLKLPLKENYPKTVIRGFTVLNWTVFIRNLLKRNLKTNGLFKERNNVVYEQKITLHTLKGG